MFKHLLILLLLAKLSCSLRPMNLRRIGKINSNLEKATNADYQTKYFHSQLLDHFNYNDTRTFSQRYLEKTPSNWTTNQPIFVYCGNEGNVDSYYVNSGFLTDTLSDLFTAKILFVEHRFFGETMPFGYQYYQNKSNFAYLTVTQAMADLVNFIKHYNRDVLQCSPKNCPKYVSFGGSYGAMLSAWMRMKFPNVFYASIASSAPLLLFKGRSNPEGYSIICTKDYNYTTAVPNCVNLMREGYERLEKYRTSGNLSYSVKQTLNSAFNLCNNSQINQPSDIQNLENWLIGAHQTMPMVDYPYPAQFEGNLPGWPCNASCNYFSAYGNVSNVSSISDSNLFSAFYQSADMFYNYQQPVACLNLYPNTTTVNYDDIGWECLACGMCPMPMTSKFDAQDMFPPSPWNYEQYTLYCNESFGIQPRYDWALDYFGGRTDASFLSYTKIFFANGKLDPWSSGGVLSTISPDLPAYYMDGAAHHLDLRHPNPADPQGVINGRNLEIYYLKKWLGVQNYDGRFDFLQTELEKMDKEELYEVFFGKKRDIAKEQEQARKEAFLGK